MHRKVGSDNVVVRSLTLQQKIEKLAVLLGTSSSNELQKMIRPLRDCGADRAVRVVESLIQESLGS